MIHTLDSDALDRRLEEFGHRGLLTPWAGDLNAARADARRYAEATALRTEPGDISLAQARVLGALFDRSSRLSSKAFGSAGILRERTLDQTTFHLRRVDEHYRPEDGAELASEEPNRRMRSRSDAHDESRSRPRSNGLPDKDAARDFYSTLTLAAKEQLPGLVDIEASQFAGPVTSHKHPRVFLSRDRTAGVAVDWRGNLASPFTLSGRWADLAPAVAQAARYADKATVYATHNGALIDVYTGVGFVPIARVKFDPKHAPKNWAYEKLGKPDLVFLVNDRIGRLRALAPKGSCITYGEGLLRVETLLQARDMQRESARLSFVAPVSDALKLEIKGVRVPRIEAAIEAIESVHQVSRLFVIPVVHGSAAYDGLYRSNHDKTPRDISISVDPDRPIALTFTHEFGHYLDEFGYGDGYFASIYSHELKPFMQLMKSSGTIDLIGKAVDDPQKLSYYTSPEELFARSYAQYISEKSGNPLLLDEIERVRLHKPFLYWKGTDFKEVSAFIGNSIRLKGWTK